MTFTDEELALRQAMSDAVVDQPDQPFDRITAVRRRHARRRTLQASVAVASVAAVAVGATFVGHSIRSSSVTPLNRPVPSWALPWPDHRDGSVSQQVLDGAVRAWRQIDSSSTGPLPSPNSVVWYAGATVVRGQAAVAVFEVDTGLGHRLVAAWTNDREVLAGGSPVTHGGSPWVVYSTDAPAPDFHGVIGLHVHGQKSSPTDFPNDWIVLLGPPAGTLAHVGQFGDVRMTDGYTAFDAGQLSDVRAPMTVTIEAKDGTRPAGGTVGVPGVRDSQVPQLAAVTPLTGVPQTPRMIGQSSGQGSLAGVNSSLRASGATTIYGRCVGAPSIHVTIDTEHNRPFASIPCDGRQHVVAGPPMRPHSPYGAGHAYEVHASDFTSWAVAVAVT